MASSSELKRAHMAALDILSDYQEYRSAVEAIGEILGAQQEEVAQSILLRKTELAVSSATAIEKNARELGRLIRTVGPAFVAASEGVYSLGGLAGTCAHDFMAHFGFDIASSLACALFEVLYPNREPGVEYMIPDIQEFAVELGGQGKSLVAVLLENIEAIHSEIVKHWEAGALLSYVDCPRYWSLLEREFQRAVGPEVSVVLPERVQEAFDLITEDGPMQGKEIVARLGDVGLKTFTKHYVPLLKKAGIKNVRGRGYFNPETLPPT